jgi:ABC-type antimicrobial peptide transport system permease subunit
MMSDGKWVWDEENGKDFFVAFTEEEKAAFRDAILKAMQDDNVEVTAVMRLFDDQTAMATGETMSLKVIGFVEATRESMQVSYLTEELASTMQETQKNTLEYYEEYETKYVADANAVYTDIYLPFDGSAERADAIWEMYSNEEFSEDDTIIFPTGVFIDTLRSADNTVKSLSKVFLYVGLVLAVFAALLFSNFISVSIAQKKKEIGILRAIGAKSSDVFKIFFSESTFIAAVCVLISGVASYIICGYLNVEMAESLGVSLLVFGLPSFAMLIGIAAVTALLATFFPVRSAARKKPIESIRAI